MAHQLEEFGGIALIIDYGHNGDKTDTFRVKNEFHIVKNQENLIVQL